MDETNDIGELKAVIQTLLARIEQLEVENANYVHNWPKIRLIPTNLLPLTVTQKSPLLSLLCPK